MGEVLDDVCRGAKVAESWLQQLPIELDCYPKLFNSSYDSADGGQLQRNKQVSRLVFCSIASIL